MDQLVVHGHRMDGFPQPSAAGTDSRVVDRDGASRANDDGYLEGLQKALGYHF